jgi:hypothetical protein
MPSRQGLFKAREEARLGARLSGRYQAMPGAARRLAPASVLSAAQFVRVRPAAQVPVIETAIAVAEVRGRWSGF